LAAGSHIFYVEAKNQAGNFSEEMCEFDVDCGVDNDPPDISLQCGTPTCQGNGGNISISWSATDNVTPSSSVEFRYRLGDEQWTPWRSYVTETTRAGLTDGVYLFTLQARDAAKNTSEEECEFEIDSCGAAGGDEPPDLEIHCYDIAQTCQANGATVDISWSATDDVTASASIQYRWKLEKGGTWTAWKTNITTTACQQVADGAHTFYVQAKDGAGNSSEEFCDFDVDCGAGGDDDPPDISLQCGNPTCQGNGGNISISWSATDNVTPSSSVEFRYRLGGEQWTPWRSYVTETTRAGLTDGVYAFALQARDAAKNISEEICEFEIGDCIPGEEEDKEQPVITIKCGAVTCSAEGGGVLISWTITDDISAAGHIDRMYWLEDEDGTVIYESKWTRTETSKTFTKLSAGKYMLYVSAEDEAGNPADVESSFSVSVECGAEAAQETTTVVATITLSEPERIKFRQLFDIEVPAELTASISEAGAAALVELARKALDAALQGSLVAALDYARQVASMLGYDLPAEGTESDGPSTLVDTGHSVGTGLHLMSDMAGLCEALGKWTDCRKLTEVAGVMKKGLTGLAAVIDTGTEYLEAEALVEKLRDKPFYERCQIMRDGGIDTLVGLLSKYNGVITSTLGAGIMGTLPVSMTMGMGSIVLALGMDFALSNAATTSATLSCYGKVVSAGGADTPEKRLAQLCISQNTSGIGTFQWSPVFEWLIRWPGLKFFGDWTPDKYLDGLLYAYASVEIESGRTLAVHLLGVADSDGSNSVTFTATLQLRYPSGPPVSFADAQMTLSAASSSGSITWPIAWSPAYGIPEKVAITLRAAPAPGNSDHTDYPEEIEIEFPASGW
jgi:hypothetical protein